MINANDIKKELKKAFKEDMSIGFKSENGFAEIIFSKHNDNKRVVLDIGKIDNTDKIFIHNYFNCSNWSALMHLIKKDDLLKFSFFNNDSDLLKEKELKHDTLICSIIRKDKKLIDIIIDSEIRRIN